MNFFPPVLTSCAQSLPTIPVLFSKAPLLHMIGVPWYYYALSVFKKRKE